MIDQGNLLFPVFVKISHLRLLLVGGGAVAFEKLETLLKNDPGLNLRIIAKKLLEPKIRELVKGKNNISLSIRKFDKKDLKNKDMVLLAVNNDKINRKVRKLCRRKNILLNVADTPDLCDFYLGSVVKKGDLKIAISTNGKSPTLAKRMRQYLEEVIPDDIQDLLDNLSELRSKLKGDFKQKVDELNKVTTDWLKERKDQ